MITICSDTNLLMECRELRQLPWAELFPEQQHIRIVLVRTVVREVDRLKSDGKGRRSRRARALSGGIFRQLLDAGGEAVIVRDASPRVDVVLGASRPDAAAHPELDLTHPDDRVIAEALAYVAAHPATGSVFVSNDTIALHTAKAHGLECRQIPGDWLAEPEPDPRQKQVEELERRLRLLEGDSPTIGIALEAAPTTIRVVRYAALPDALIADLVENLKKRFPVRVNFHDPSSVVALRALGQFLPPSPREIEEYQANKYPEWIQTVERRLTSIPERLSAETRCVEVTIEITNTGGAPAREVQLEFWLSDGLLFLHPPDKARRRMAASPLPGPPEPPAGKWPGDHFGSLLGLSHGLDPFPALDRFRQERRDPHDFYYKPVPDDRDPRHVLECEVFRHRVEPELFPFLVFAERDVTGGTIKCRVTASNLSDPAVAEFPIRIEYEDGDAVQTARDLVAQIGRNEDDEL